MRWRRRGAHAKGDSPGAAPVRSPRLARWLLVVGVVLCVGGATAVGVALATQVHAPQPTPAQAGSVAPPGVAKALAGASVQVASAEAPSWSGFFPHVVGPVLKRSVPVSISIPAIGVRAPLMRLGLEPDGQVQVPPLFKDPQKAGWYVDSPTPGQVGPSVILGHIDNVLGPAVFFRLGALKPGDLIDVSLADGTVAVFKVDGVRQYPKSHFPNRLVYGPTDFAALRVITCGGPFDPATHQYLDSTVVFASLVRGEHPASST